MAHGFGKFVRDLFTDSTGETWAIGRVYSIPVLFTGLSIPVLALYRNQTIAMTDVGVLLAGVAGACLLLIRGTSGVDLSDPAHPHMIDDHRPGEPPR